MLEKDKRFEFLIVEKEDFVYSDFLLIRKMRQGDDIAFDSFVRRYYQEILNYCYYHCFDRAYAEDLTQETFVRFFAKLPDYHYRGKTLNYLYTIAGNLCKDYLKKIKEIPMEEVELLRGENGEARQIEDVLNKIFMRQKLEQLPNELYDVLILYYFQELKLTEISEVLQIGLSLVKYRLKQARMQLEELLSEEEEHESGRKNTEV